MSFYISTHKVQFSETGDEYQGTKIEKDAVFSGVCGYVCVHACCKDKWELVGPWFPENTCYSNTNET